MSAASSSLGALTLAQRLRFAAAGTLGVLGLALLWAGFGLSAFLPLQNEAVAESAPADLRNPPLSLISREQAALLQSTVDSTALSLSGVLASAPSASFLGGGENEGFAPLAAALSTLTFRLGGDIYFTAWEDTTMLHSPLAPDAKGMNFADAVDGRGAAFVLGMADAAISGGGFLKVSLPRKLFAPNHTGHTSSKATSKNPAAFQALDSTPIDQVVYVRHIPRSRWHIAAFMPADSRPGQGFSTLWSAPASTGAGTSTDRLEADYRKGLSISGFSLAGLAGLMLVPGGWARREENPVDPKQS